MGVLHIRQHVEDAVLLPGAVRVEPGGVGFRVRHADVSPGREGFQSGEHQARAEGRPGLELVAHIEGEAAGEVGVVGVDEGALPGAQDGARAGEGEAGGVGRASSGDFQHALFHRQGGVVSFIRYFLRIPAEDRAVFQQEGASIEGGIRQEAAVPAGGEMLFFPLVEFAAEDDRSFRVVNIPLPVRVAVEREGHRAAGVFVPAGNRVVEADFTPLFRGKRQIGRIK